VSRHAHLLILPSEAAEFQTSNGIEKCAKKKNSNSRSEAWRTSADRRAGKEQTKRKRTRRFKGAQGKNGKGGRDGKMKMKTKRRRRNETHRRGNGIGKVGKMKVQGKQSGRERTGEKKRRRVQGARDRKRVRSNSTDTMSKMDATVGIYSCAERRRSSVFGSASSSVR
jgi:hypothetical protein